MAKSCVVDNDIVLLSQAIKQSTNPMVLCQSIELAVASQGQDFHMQVCSHAAMQQCVIRKILFIVRLTES